MMEIKKYISVFYNTLDVGHIANIIRWCTTQEFLQGKVVNLAKPADGVNKTTRNAKTLGLHPRCPSLTNVHWYNFISWTVARYFDEYKRIHCDADLSVSQISEIGILKYDTGGFYKPHTDHHLKFPRIISIIVYLNNDYEGGELVFYDPDQKSNPYKINVKPGRMIMWPSNFLYPHEVRKVTKGTRYSIISWIS